MTSNWKEAIKMKRIYAQQHAPNGEMKQQNAEEESSVITGNKNHMI